MTQSSLKDDVALAIARAEAVMQAGTRTVVGVAGPPASGKSTLAELMVETVNQSQSGPVPRAVLLPMDGYHLDNRILESRGLLARKGAPETFDAAGFCDAVAAVKSAARMTYHPKFDRQMDLAIANAVAIHPETPLVVVEGNYLLLQDDPWARLGALFDLTVFVSPSRDDLKKRLQQRWLTHGLDAETALARATSNDLPNADRILRDSAKADLHLSQDYSEFGVRYAF